MMKVEKIIDALKGAVAVLDYHKEQGVQVCRCNKGFVCSYCFAKETLVEAQDTLDSQDLQLANPRQKVFCITTGELFNTIKDASEMYDIPASNISKCCNGQLRSAGKVEGEKMKWRFAKGDDLLMPISLVIK